MFRVFLTGVEKRDKALHAISRGLGASKSEADHSYNGTVPVLWGFGDPTEGRMVRLWKEKKPFLHLDHAYFKRGYEHGNVRLNFRHFHQTKLLDVPDDRATLARKRLEPWRTGRHIVVVVPSERICAVLSQVHNRRITAKDWCRETELEVKRYTDRPILRKDKGGSFLDVLKNAHAVVSLSSVAEVESVVHGVPVFVSEDSPAFQVGLQDLSRIENPVYPEREQWLRSLSYSQFHVSELADAKIRTILERVYGDLDVCRT